MSSNNQPDIAQTYGRLLGYVQPYKALMAIALCAAFIHGLADASLSRVIEQVGFYLEDDPQTKSWAIYIPLIFVILSVIRGVMDFVTVYFLSRVGRSVVRDIRGQLFRHYLSMPAKYYDGSSTGELLSKLTYNTEQVAEAISNAVTVLIKDALVVVFLIGVLIYFSWQLTLLVAVVTPVVALLVAALSRAFRRYSERIQSSMGDVTRVAEQSLLGHLVVKIFQSEAQESENFSEFNQQNYRLHVRLSATRAIGESLTQFVIALGVAAIVFVAFSDLLGDSISAATFMAYIFALAQLLAPLRRLININAIVQRGIAAAASVFEVIDDETEIDSGERTLDRAIGDVEFADVSFAYDAEKGHVLNHISLRLPAGSNTAFVGKSGSGKSSLVGLLPRFYDADTGSIKLDGIDIREYQLADLRRQIALVSQDVVLFDTTIAKNIAYGAMRNASRAAIEAAAEAANVLEFARDLPNGLDTLVGERGGLVSGGQRQRIAIARALLKDAPVLILDEATSALDSESERKIQDALDRLIENRTTLVIAHRLSTIEKADLIVVLDDGVIVETGTHNALLNANGLYAALYRMQFAG